MKVLKPPSQFIMNEGSSPCLARLDVFVVGFAGRRQEGRRHNRENVGISHSELWWRRPADGHYESDWTGASVWRAQLCRLPEKWQSCRLN